LGQHYTPPPLLTRLWVRPKKLGRKLIWLPLCFATILFLCAFIHCQQQNFLH
jgi:hypothetical protein